MSMWAVASVVAFSAIVVSAETSSVERYRHVIQDQLSELDFSGDSKYAGQAHGAKKIVETLLEQRQDPNPANPDETKNLLDELFDRMIDLLASTLRGWEGELSALETRFKLCEDTDAIAAFERDTSTVRGYETEHTACMANKQDLVKEYNALRAKVNTFMDKWADMTLCGASGIYHWKQAPTDREAILRDAGFKDRVNKLLGLWTQAKDYMQDQLTNNEATWLAMDKAKADLDEASKECEGIKSVYNNAVCTLGTSLSTLNSERLRCEKTPLAELISKRDNYMASAEPFEGYARMLTKFKCMLKKTEGDAVTVEKACADELVGVTFPKMQFKPVDVPKLTPPVAMPEFDYECPEE